jgi:hypothetical protein
LALWYVERNLGVQQFNSGNEIKEVMRKIWYHSAFDNIQGILQKRMSRPPWAIENGAEYAHK